MKSYRCKACIKFDITKLWVCRVCKRLVCFHAARYHAVNGQATCRKCAWREVRSFNEKHGLTRREGKEPL